MGSGVMEHGRLADLRRSYERGGLDEGDLAADPFTQFGDWLQAATDAGLREPNAMVLATAAADGRPSARTVLLKGYDERGFTFFTNYGSRKGGELAANPRAALVFPWVELERQVIVVGDVTRTTAAEAATYFARRPRGSQLGALASEQSSVLASRAQLEARRAELEAHHPDGADVPMPEHWGGFRVRPETVEFWQGRTDRLHDRLRFRRAAGSWRVERLSP